MARKLPFKRRPAGQKTANLDRAVSSLLRLVNGDKGRITEGHIASTAANTGIPKEQIVAKLKERKIL